MTFTRSLNRYWPWTLWCLCFCLSIWWDDANDRSCCAASSTVICLQHHRHILLMHHNRITSALQRLYTHQFITELIKVISTTSQPVYHAKVKNGAIISFWLVTTFYLLLLLLFLPQLPSGSGQRTAGASALDDQSTCHNSNAITGQIDVTLNAAVWCWRLPLTLSTTILQ